MINADKPTPDKVLQSFWSSFEWPARPTTAIGDDMVLPYIAYTGADSFFLDGDVSGEAHLYQHTSLEVTINAKEREIAERIGREGIRLPCQGGYIWIKRGTPFSRSLKDTDDITLKHRYLSVFYEFIK